MDSSTDIELPEIVPVMTLQGTVLFPHAVMPLFIFEKRYRSMLADVLANDRLFAVFNEAEENTGGLEEPPAIMGTVGVVRAAHQNPDGTTNLALQGISRVRLIEIVRESPYRLIRVAPCSNADGHSPDIQPARRKILSLVKEQEHLTAALPPEYVDFIRSIEQPEAFIDVAAQAFSISPSIKQTLLETLSIPRRFQLLLQHLKLECDRHDLFRRLQGSTLDDDIGRN